MEEHYLSADDVIITDRLGERPSRAADYAAESRAMEALARELAERPENLLQKLAETLVELGIAESAGISIDETGEGRHLRWVALAGIWSHLRGGTMPFDASPCGVVVQRDKMLLFESPERYFPEARIEPLIHETLLVPFHSGGRPVGTLWANTHSPKRKLDQEDARLLQALARFASAGYQMTRAFQAAEAGRLESDTRLRALAHASSDVFYVMSADMRELRELAGGNFIADAASPTRDWLQDYIPPEDRARTLTAIREAISSKGVFELEHRVRRIDGEVGWALSRAVPILGADGEIVEWFGAASDVTARKLADLAQRESEKRQAFLLKLSDALRPLADPLTIQQVAARVLGEHLAASRVAYVEIIGDEYVIRRDYIDGVPSMVGRHPVASFGSGKLADYDAGKARVVRDTRADVHNASSDNANFAAFHVRAGIGVPLIKDGSFVANLVVHMNVPRTWSPAEVALVEETAERTWQAVERAHAEAASRESAEKYHSLFRSIDDGFALIEFLPEREGGSPDFRFVEVNEAFEQQTGNSDVVGKLGSQINPGVDAVWIETFADTARSGEATRFEIHHQATARWYNVSANPVGGAGSRQLCVVFADTTERKEREKRQDFLLKLSDALRPLADAVEIMTAASEALGRHLNVGRCAYCEVEESGDYFVVERDWTDGVMPSFAGRHFFGFGDQFLEDYRAGKSVLIDDALADARAAGGEASFEEAGGVRASIGIPLIKGGRFAAGFFVQQRAPRHWTAQEEALTREVAERTWAAVERARAEAALRVSEERLRQFGEASQDILWIRDAATLQWTYLTPAFETIYGLSRDDALSGDDYRNWQDLIVAEDHAHAVASIERVLAGEQVTFEYRVRRPSDGAIRWLRNTDFPIFDEAGKVVSIGGVGHDMTDLKAVQAAIAESEVRLRTLMEGIPQLVWRSCNEGRWTWASPQWLDFTGQGQEESHGLGWLDAVHPDDRDATMLAWEKARSHGMLDVEYRVRRAADGAWLWHHTRSVPVRDAGGAIIEWLGTTTDVHGLRELQERQGVLVAELQHRTRNLITVVRSLSDRTVGNAASLDDFRGRFGRRLAALSRVQGLLSHLSAGERVDFDELLRSELSALGVAEGKAERVTLVGPSDVPLRSATVQTLALALHELATNAVKYGALAAGAANAHLTVRWHVDPPTANRPPILHVDWRETGVDMPEVGAPPRGGGYGRELIERALPYQLGAETTYELGGDGVRCTIEMPISRKADMRSKQA